ncbi:hypothetical protein DFP72DRAFT_904138 [Ephemerocybe angulata]|uniref:Uncharacterized protein n=1 Tax=Ephemerocybe angulata TaxID=980116 RepID=A0A8H6HSW2_9AGAR|nr:hypothetical protein DFP72DRAFT_904138 [Tulosesus angulatus]
MRVSPFTLISIAASLATHFAAYTPEPVRTSYLPPYQNNQRTVGKSRKNRIFSVCSSESSASAILLPTGNGLVIRPPFPSIEVQPAELERQRREPRSAEKITL